MRLNNQREYQRFYKLLLVTNYYSKLNSFKIIIISFRNFKMTSESDSENEWLNQKLFVSNIKTKT